MKKVIIAIFSIVIIGLLILQIYKIIDVKNSPKNLVKYNRILKNRRNKNKKST